MRVACGGDTPTLNVLKSKRKKNLINVKKKKMGREALTSPDPRLCDVGG